MNALKIPDLSLYRGKRVSKVGQYDRMITEGVDLLGKVRNKQHLDEIQSQLYLDNYRTNLQHFVSPSKYRDKADYYLKSWKNESSIRLKPTSFPHTRVSCPRCYNRELTQQKQCFCQIQQRVSKPNYVKIEVESKKEVKMITTISHQKQKKENIGGFPKEVEATLDIGEMREKEEVLSSKRSWRKDVEVSYRRYSSLQSLELSISRQKKEESNYYPRFNMKRQNNTRFLQDLRSKEDYLNGIDMNSSGSQSSLHVDFNDLNNAKQEYVDKSKEFLARLNRIIQQSEQPPSE